MSETQAGQCWNFLNILELVLHNFELLNGPVGVQHKAFVNATASCSFAHMTYLNQFYWFLLSSIYRT